MSKTTRDLDQKATIKVIWAHPRHDSLTARAVAAIKSEAERLGFSISELDLYRSEFNPVLRTVDEPDFQSTTARSYSDEVHELAGSLEGYSAAIIVYPVWWYSLPAILKGYIERVWNYGLLYGLGKKLPFDSIRWVALVGGGERRYVAEQWDVHMEKILSEGISQYCGVDDSTVTFLYNTLAYEEHEDDLAAHHVDLIDQAASVVRSLMPSESVVHSVRSND